MVPMAEDALAATTSRVRPLRRSDSRAGSRPPPGRFSGQNRTETPFSSRASQGARLHSSSISADHHLGVRREILSEADAEAPCELPHVGGEQDLLLRPGFVAVEKDREALARLLEDLRGVVGGSAVLEGADGRKDPGSGCILEVDGVRAVRPRKAAANIIERKIHGGKDSALPFGAP